MRETFHKIITNPTVLNEIRHLFILFKHKCKKKEPRQRFLLECHTQAYGQPTNQTTQNAQIKNAQKTSSHFVSI